MLLTVLRLQSTIYAIMIKKTTLVLGALLLIQSTSTLLYAQSSNQNTISQSEHYGRWTGKLSTNTDIDELVVAKDAYYEALYEELEGQMKKTGYKDYFYWKKEWLPRLSGSSLLESLQAEYTYIDQLNQSFVGGAPPYEAVDGGWTEIGPVEVPDVGDFYNSIRGIGRIDHIEFDPDNESRMLACAPTGGVFLSEDAGHTWTSAGMDFLPVVGASWVEIAPNTNNGNTWIVATGTGEWPVKYDLSNGLWRTFNAGASWHPISMDTEMVTNFNYSWNEVRIRKFWMNQNDPNIIVVASNNGIFKTTNALSYFPSNVSWEKVLEPNIHLLEGDAIEDEIFIDIVQKPDDANELYASGTSAIYWSHDMGDTWELLPNINELIYPTHIEKDRQRIAIRTSPANPDLLYIFTSLKYPGFQIYDTKFEFAIFNRADHSLINYHDGMHDYAPYRSQSVVVSPVDESIIYYGNAKTMKKLKLETHEDNTITTTLLSVNKDWHDDIHYLHFASDNESIWMAHDGGIAKGTPVGESGNLMVFDWQNHYSGLGVANIYNGAWSEQRPKNFLYGAQDTGCMLKEGDNNWKTVDFGDGYAVKFHPSYPDVSFVSSQKFLDGSVNNGASYFSNIIEADHGFHMDFNHQNDNILYTAGDGVKEITFNDLPNSVTDKTIRNLTEIYYPEYDCYKVWSAPSNENVVYAHMIHKNNDGDHLFIRTINASDALDDIVWENLYSIGGWEDIYIADEDRKDLEFPKIAIDDEDPLKCWLMRSIWGEEVDKIFLLENEQWSVFDPEHKLGIINPTSILHQHGSEDRIIVGTDRGLFYTQPSMDMEWLKLEGMPHASINEVNINYCAQKIRVVTMGRGIWEAKLPPIESEKRITSNQTWNDKKVLRNNIRVESGATLIIKAEVQFPKDGYIYVEKGAKLILNEAHLHNVCGMEWAGIFVEGDQNLPQGNSPHNSEQGVVFMVNQSIIEGANCGVKLIGYTPQGGVEWGSAGGILHATNSKFINCRKAVEFMAYQNTNTNGQGINNMSFIHNCEFLINEQVNEIFPGSSQVEGITLYKVDGVDILGCDFKLELPVDAHPNHKYSGAAISSVDASYRLDAYNDTDLNPPTKRSHISGFRYGVFANNSDNLACIRVEKSDFIDNQVGVFLNNADYSSISQNNFELQSFAPGSSILSLGLYIEESSGYKVEENTFLGISPISTTTAGMVVKDSGPDYNQLYRNDFRNLGYGIGVYGLNAPDPTDLPVLESSGLHINCNDFGDNSSLEANFAEGTNDIFLNADAFIDQSQGEASNPAGNRFSNYPLNQEDGNYKVNNDYYNGGGIIYFHNSDQITRPYPRTEERVVAEPTIYNYTEDIACPSNWTSDPIVFEADIKQIRDAKYQERKLLIDNYKNILNGGIKPDIMEVLLDDFASTSQVHAKLLAGSPYLSDDVLIAAITRNIPLNQWDLALVLTLNAKLSPRVMKVFNQSQPLTPFLANLVLNADGSSMRYILELGIAAKNKELAQLDRDYIQGALFDASGEPAYESIAALYESPEDLQQLQTTVSALLKQQNSRVAQQKLDDYLAAHPDASLELMQMQIDLLKQQIDWLQLNEQQYSSLEGIANNNLSPEQSKAKALLDFINNNPLPPFELPVEENPAPRQAQQQAYSTEPRAIMSIAPNPNDGELYVSYDLPQNYSTAELILHNNLGQRLAAWDISKYPMLYKLDCSAYPSGIYTLSLRVDEEKIETQKWTLIAE